MSFFLTILTISVILVSAYWYKVAVCPAQVVEKETNLPLEEPELDQKGTFVLPDDPIADPFIRQEIVKQLNSVNENRWVENDLLDGKIKLPGVRESPEDIIIPLNSQNEIQGKLRGSFSLKHIPTPALIDSKPCRPTFCEKNSLCQCTNNTLQQDCCVCRGEDLCSIIPSN